MTLSLARHTGAVSLLSTPAWKLGGAPTGELVDLGSTFTLDALGGALERWTDDDEDSGGSFTGSDYWEGPGVVGPAVSPDGTDCSSLPHAGWFQDWVARLGLGAPVYELYDDDYPLGSDGTSWVAEWMFGPLADLMPEPDGVEWAERPSGTVVGAAVALLTSSASRNVVDELLEPLGALTSRVRAAEDRDTDPEDAERRGESDTDATTPMLDLPLVDPVTTPLVRVLRRFAPIDEQGADWSVRSGTLAVDPDGSTATIFDWLNLRIDVELPGDVGEALPLPAYEPAAQGDRAYNPVIGVLSGDSLFMQGFWTGGGGVWTGGGLAGLALTPLMPLRAPPSVVSLPLNWKVSNQAELIGPLAAAIVDVDAKLWAATGTYGLAGLLADAFGVELPESFSVFAEWVAESEQQLITLPPEIHEEIRDALAELDVANPLDGMARDVRRATGLAGLIAGATGKAVFELGLPLAIIVAIAVMLGVRKLADKVEVAEDALDDILDSLLEALAGLSTPGAAPNDLMATAFMAIGTTLQAANEVFEEFGAEFDAEDLGTALVLGIDGDEFTALTMGLAGRVYAQQLEDIVEGVDDLAPEERMTLPPQIADAAEAMLEEHEEIVPVWMLDPTFFDWAFDDYAAYPGYRHATEVGGEDLSGWVEKTSPLYQVIRAVDTASALLEAGLQAESTFLAGSGLGTYLDSMGQIIRLGLEPLGFGKLHEVLPEISIPRFVGALWRQAMIDRLLIELDAEGVELDCVYELVPWMASAADRAAVDRLLGELDPELGRRRYEEGLFGDLANYDERFESWRYFDNLDAAWAELPCDDRSEWQAAVQVLVSRGGLTELQALIDATASDVDAAHEPDIVDESDRVVPDFALDALLDGTWALEPSWVPSWLDEVVGAKAWDMLALSRDEIWVGPFVPALDTRAYASAGVTWMDSDRLVTLEELVGETTVFVGPKGRGW